MCLYVKTQCTFCYKINRRKYMPRIKKIEDLPDVQNETNHKEDSVFKKGLIKLEYVELCCRVM